MRCRIFTIFIGSLFLLPFDAGAKPHQTRLKSELIEKIEVMFPERYHWYARGQLNKIHFVEPDVLVDHLQEMSFELLASGFNGTVWVTKNRKQMIKVSNFLPLDHLLSLYARPEPAIPNPDALKKEILGTLLWNIFAIKHGDSRRIPLPFLVANDGSGYVRPFITGKPASEISKTPQLWKAVLEIQERGEEILLETGVGVDLASFANLIALPRSSDEVALVPVDLELMKPTDQTVVFYAAKGRSIPQLEYPLDWRWVVWPLMPEHVVMSKNWGLTLEEAQAWVRARYGLKNGQALLKLAALPRWKFPVSSSASYSVLDQACAALVAAGPVPIAEPVTGRLNRWHNKLFIR